MGGEMMIVDAELERLRAAIGSRGYRPAQAEIASLFALFSTVDRDQAEVIERSLARLGTPLVAEVQTRFVDAKPPLRGRLVALFGRLVSKSVDAAQQQFLLAALSDADSKTRRNAAMALGRVGGDEAIAALQQRLQVTDEVIELRVLAAALGKVGNAASLTALAALSSTDAELCRIVAEAKLKIGRSALRERGKKGSSIGAIVADVAPSQPLLVWAHCRAGLADLLCAELRQFSPQKRDASTVELRLTAPLQSLFAARTMLRFSFPLPHVGAPIAALPALGQAVVSALTSSTAATVFAAFNRGPIRYRIEWSDAGHRRGLTFRCAQAVNAIAPHLLNDPTESLWELLVHEPRESLKPVELALWPRRLPDRRFDYRVAQLPASSHPTIAAALSQVAAVTASDVIWDPFVGAGSELIECARRGTSRAYFGSDMDPAALAAAQQNLAAAQLAAELQIGDARQFKPRLRPTLIITNPPLGRRLLSSHETGPLYQDFLQHVGQLLAPKGRLVWISPRPADTRSIAKRCGLWLEQALTVDMGGFFAELQSFRKL